MIPRLTLSFCFCNTGNYPSKKCTLSLHHCCRLILIMRFCLKPKGDLPTQCFLCFLPIGEFSSDHFWTKLRWKLGQAIMLPLWLDCLSWDKAIPNGINGSFGHNNRLFWFWSNIDGFFCEDGPLSSYMFLLLTMFWFVMWGEHNCLPNPFMIVITLTSSPVLLTRMCPNGLDVFSNFFRPRRTRLQIMQWQQKQGMNGNQSWLV